MRPHRPDRRRPGAARMARCSINAVSSPKLSDRKRAPSLWALFSRTKIQAKPRPGRAQTSRAKASSRTWSRSLARASTAACRASSAASSAAKSATPRRLTVTRMVSAFSAARMNWAWRTAAVAEIPIWDTMKSIWPFCAAGLIMLALVTCVPALTLRLPAQPPLRVSRCPLPPSTPP